MNIQEAVKEAHEKGLAIRRNTSDRDQIYCVIVPTNTRSSCLIDCDYYGEYPARVERRWNPLLEDLLADDWEVVD